MAVGRRVGFGVVGLVFALSGGCGGRVKNVSGSGTGDGAATGNGAAASADSDAGVRSSGGTGGSAGTPVAPAKPDTAAARARACRLYFTIQSSQPCPGPKLPPSETARLAPSFEQSCVGEFDKPGNDYTAEALEACANALGTAECPQPESLRECDFRGSLPAGAPCVTGTQCQSGRCNGTSHRYAFEKHWGGVDTCGTCDTVARVGEPCSGGCEKGALCVDTVPDARGPRSVCRAITGKALGEPCDGDADWCVTGTYCNNSRKVCEQPPESGERCPSNLCAPSLVCHYGRVTDTQSAHTTCGPLGNADDDCKDTGDHGCAPDLGCVHNDRDKTDRCLPIRWVGPGEVCDDARRCLVGSCPYVGLRVMGTCPKTIPDGQPCTSGSQCEALSHCLNPTAHDGVETGICGPISSVVCSG